MKEKRFKSLVYLLVEMLGWGNLITMAFGLMHITALMLKIWLQLLKEDSKLEVKMLKEKMVLPMVAGFMSHRFLRRPYPMHL